MKIVVDQDACIGAASCVAIAAKTFALDQEGKAYILNEAPDAERQTENNEVIVSQATEGMDVREMIIEAARSCPTLAIKLYEDDGTEIVL